MEFAGSAKNYLVFFVKTVILFVDKSNLWLTFHNQAEVTMALLYIGVFPDSSALVILVIANFLSWNDMELGMPYVYPMLWKHHCCYFTVLFVIVS